MIHRQSKSSALANHPAAGERKLSRRRAAQLGGAGLSTAILAPLGAHAQATPQSLPVPVQEIIDSAKYRPSHWGICIAGLDTGEFLHEIDAD